MSPPKFIFTVNTKHTFENAQLPPLEELFFKAKVLHFGVRLWKNRDNIFGRGSGVLQTKIAWD